MISAILSRVIMWVEWSLLIFIDFSKRFLDIKVFSRRLFGPIKSKTFDKSALSVLIQINAISLKGLSGFYMKTSFAFERRKKRKITKNSLVTKRISAIVVAAGCDVSRNCRLYDHLICGHLRNDLVRWQHFDENNKRQRRMQSHYDIASSSRPASKGTIDFFCVCLIGRSFISITFISHDDKNWLNRKSQSSRMHAQLNH